MPFPSNGVIHGAEKYHFPSDCVIYGPGTYHFPHMVSFIGKYHLPFSPVENLHASYCMPTNYIRKTSVKKEISPLRPIYLLTYC